MNHALQCHLRGRQHNLLVMRQDEQDLDHPLVAAGLPKQMLLQPLEGLGQFSEGN